MAMSFSRDDSRGPGEAGDVADVQFSTARKGFDQDQVRAHLRAVAREIADLRARAERLERERDDARAASADPDVRLDDEALTRLLGEETARVLTTARESAAEIRSKAEEAAARLLAEAGDEATRLREEAELEASRRRADAANDAEAELSMAKQQGREMVNEARAYRERVLTELARRRELAREQIEQLVHGRDRLVAAFERARLAAVDVMSEMQPIGEPDEYVDLQPTTGPVPVMVARSDLDTRPAEDTQHGSTADDDPAAHGADATARPFDHQSADDVAIESADAADGADESAGPSVVEAPVEAGELDGDESQPTQSDADGDEPGDDTHEAEPVDHATHEVALEAEPIDEDDEVDDGTAADRSHLTAVDDHDGDDAHDDVPDSATEPVVANDTADASDDGDVVVDLFARLRASREPEADSTTDDTAHADDHGADAADTDATDAAAEPVEAPTVSAATTLGSLPDEAVREEAASDESDPTHPTDPADGDVAHGSGDAETPFERRDADVTPLITSAARRLKRVLADEQNGVLETLRRSDDITSVDDIVPWVGEHAGTYTDAIADELLAAARAGAATTSPDGSDALTAAEGRDAVQHAADAVETWLVVPLRDRLGRAVADGTGDNAAITKKVRAVYREFKTTHIDEHLDDVVRTAYGWGSLAGFSTGSTARWAIDPRTGACHPDCEDNALEGAIPAGEPFPTGAVVAPGHPGCVCLLVHAD